MKVKVTCILCNLNNQASHPARSCMNQNLVSSFDWVRCGSK